MPLAGDTQRPDGGIQTSVRPEARWFHGKDISLSSGNRLGGVEFLERVKGSIKPRDTQSIGNKARKKAAPHFEDFVVVPSDSDEDEVTVLEPPGGDLPASVIVEKRASSPEAASIVPADVDGSVGRGDSPNSESYTQLDDGWRLNFDQEAINVEFEYIDDLGMTHQSSVTIEVVMGDNEEEVPVPDAVGGPKTAQPKAAVVAALPESYAEKNGRTGVSESQVPGEWKENVKPIIVDVESNDKEDSHMESKSKSENESSNSNKGENCNDKSGKESPKATADKKLTVLECLKVANGGIMPRKVVVIGRRNNVVGGGEGSAGNASASHSVAATSPSMPKQVAKAEQSLPSSLPSTVPDNSKSVCGSKSLTNICKGNKGTKQSEGETSAGVRKAIVPPIVRSCSSSEKVAQAEQSLPSSLPSTVPDNSKSVCGSKSLTNVCEGNKGTKQSEGKTSAGVRKAIVPTITRSCSSSEKVQYTVRRPEVRTPSCSKGALAADESSPGATVPGWHPVKPVDVPQAMPTTFKGSSQIPLRFKKRKYVRRLMTASPKKQTKDCDASCDGNEARDDVAGVAGEMNGTQDVVSSRCKDGGDASIERKEVKSGGLPIVSLPSNLLGVPLNGVQSSAPPVVILPRGAGSQASAVSSAANYVVLGGTQPDKVVSQCVPGVQLSGVMHGNNIILMSQGVSVPNVAVNSPKTGSKALSPFGSVPHSGLPSTPGKIAVVPKSGKAEDGANISSVSSLLTIRKNSTVEAETVLKKLSKEERSNRKCRKFGLSSKDYTVPRKILPKAPDAVPVDVKGLYHGPVQPVQREAVGSLKNQVPSSQNVRFISGSVPVDSVQRSGCVLQSSGALNGSVANNIVYAPVLPSSVVQPLCAPLGNVLGNSKNIVCAPMLPSSVAKPFCVSQNSGLVNKSNVVYASVLPSNVVVQSSPGFVSVPSVPGGGKPCTVPPTPSAEVGVGSFLQTLGECIGSTKNSSGPVGTQGVKVVMQAPLSLTEADKLISKGHLSESPKGGQVNGPPGGPLVNSVPMVLYKVAPDAKASVGSSSCGESGTSGQQPVGYLIGGTALNLDPFVGKSEPRVKKKRKEKELRQWKGGEVSLKGKRLRCGLCDLVFFSMDMMDEHLTSHAGNKWHWCSHCWQRFQHKNELEYHICIHLGLNPPLSLLTKTCERCGITVLHRDFGIHELLHRGGRPFDCAQCGKAFRTKSNLNSHLVSHQTEKNVECPVCSKRLKRKSALAGHLLLHMNRTPEFFCSQCGRGFPTASRLRMHEVVHTTEKNFECPICGKQFKTKVSARYHLQRHTRREPLACAQCGHKYTSKEGLRNHQKKWGH